MPQPPEPSEAAPFTDQFDYSTGDLATQSSGAWVNLTNSINVATIPTGSASGPNVVVPVQSGSAWYQVGREFGSTADVLKYDFRLSIYSGTATANDAMQMRITNNTSEFNSSSNRNIVFQLGIDNGILSAQQGQTDGNGVYASVTAGNAVDDHWYEFRAVYNVKDGPDTVDIDYRDVTAGGAWTDLAFFDMDADLDNELSWYNNNFAINSRDYSGLRICRRRRIRHNHFSYARRRQPRRNGR